MSAALTLVGAAGALTISGATAAALFARPGTPLRLILPAAHLRPRAMVLRRAAAFFLPAFAPGLLAIGSGALVGLALKAASELGGDAGAICAAAAVGGGSFGVVLAVTVLRAREAAPVEGPEPRAMLCAANALRMEATPATIDTACRALRRAAMARMDLPRLKQGDAS